MGIRKGKTPRRREVRRTLKQPARPWLAWIGRREVIWSILLFLAFTTLGSLVAVSGQARQRYRVDHLATETIVSRVKFRAIDKAETDTRRALARAGTPPFYRANTAYLQKLRTQFDALIAVALDETIERADQIEPDLRQSLKLSDATLRDLRLYTETQEVPDQDDSVLIVRQPKQEWQARIDQFLEGLASIAVLSSEERNRIERDAQHIAVSHITIDHPNQGEKEQFFSTLHGVDDSPRAFKEHVTPLAARFPSKNIARSIVTLVMLNRQPTYLYDAQETFRRQKLRYDSVADVDRNYNRDDVLVLAGSRMTEFDLAVIREERGAYLTSLTPLQAWMRHGANIAIILCVAASLWVYLGAYYPRVMGNATRGLALVALLLLCQSVAVFLTSVRPDLIYLMATFPCLLATAVLAIAYNQRFALAIGSLLSLLVTISLGLSVTFAMVLLAGVGAAVSLLAEVRTRSKLMQVGIASGVAMAAMTWIVCLAQRRLGLDGVWALILRDSLWALASGIGTGMFTQSILPLVEKVFKVITSMTLKDLNDASHPLLRRLAEQAPGTYAHSLRMADMGEAAADAIGANGLMCRVGAMYHDVGKINKPAYFVENQSGGPNKHTKLSPAMSLLIIVGHVKDGIEMAREYGLPTTLRHFIESHHGTTLVEYFYHAAKQQREGEGKDAPAEFEYRYPGPKPTTPEAAIIMLCDGVEGAARTLSEPNPARIEQLVHQMAMKRLMDGQFNECSLTLQELHKIETAITKTVRALYHGRVAYPSEEKEPQREHRPEATVAAS